MMPSGSLSTLPDSGEFLETVNSTLAPLVDYELGGVALNDPSQGLMFQLWRARYVTGMVYLGPDGGTEQELFTRPNVTELALAFDQNMNPSVAFVQAGSAWLRWFDTVAGDNVFTEIPGAVNPRLTLDDKRSLEVINSDIILAYLRGGSLYYRQQRDRYEIEYLLTASPPCGGLSKLAMNTQGRLQFAFGGA